MKMNITKSYVILFLVVVMTNSLSNSEVLVAPGMLLSSNYFGHFQSNFY